jgi:hypothetical protein
VIGFSQPLSSSYFTFTLASNSRLAGNDSNSSPVVGSRYAVATLMVEKVSRMSSLVTLREV